MATASWQSLRFFQSPYVQINTLHSSLAAYRHVYLAQEEENDEKTSDYGDL
jgi:hypothetical protein